MIKLNRMTEYGLMALRHMSRKSDQAARSFPIPTVLDITSAREIADTYGLPFEITAKTLQRLKDAGLIESAHGAKGGYTLLKALEQVSLAEFIESMEGSHGIVPCSGAGSERDSGLASNIENETTCEYGKRCEIKQVMSQLNSRVFDFLSKIYLKEMIR